jgi:hypothetical protein
MEAAPRIPDLDGPVFAAGNEPLAFVVKGDGSDVGSMALERNQLRRTNMRGAMGIRNWMTGLQERKTSCQLRRC